MFPRCYLVTQTGTEHKCSLLCGTFLTPPRRRGPALYCLPTRQLHYNSPANPAQEQCLVAFSSLHLAKAWHKVGTLNVEEINKHVNKWYHFLDTSSRILLLSFFASCPQCRHFSTIFNMSSFALERVSLKMSLEFSLLLWRFLYGIAYS